MKDPRRPASFLASVTGENEARLCAELGADIIDAKNPVQGALGALPGERVRAIRAAVPPHVPVSATIGDPQDDPDTVAQAARFMAAAGADIVKVGFWPLRRQDAVARRLAALTHVRLVAVLLVDDGLDLELITPLRDARFLGIMLDTADKRAGALPDRLASDVLAEFVNVVQGQGLFAGLAGSLRAEHVPQLLALEPDVLGFRGGLCRAGARTSGIDAEAVRAVRATMPGSEACGTAPAGAMAPWQSGRAV
jgi:(5-formylfuran-3-yl)methyl phosphate synthase